jgi:drug/metabolite transporter (DMT)-like permease
MNGPATVAIVSVKHGGPLASISMCDVLAESYHLLFPLLASLLFVCGLLLLKRASVAGTNPWTVSLVANLWAAVLFSGFCLVPAEPIPWGLVWQPALVALFYIAGQVGTFLAINHGDVSIAAPLFGVKVLLVAMLSSLIGAQALPLAIWLAAILATIGVALVQWTGGGRHSRIGYTVLSALGASISFSFFDVLVQACCASPGAVWSSSRFLPIMFWSVAVYSTIFLPAFQRDKLFLPRVRWSLLIGGLLIASQAVCVVFALSVFGDAPRVNVVYSMRGIWGVLLAWATALMWGGGEAQVTRAAMLLRLAGALTITVSVVIAILFG